MAKRRRNNIGMFVGLAVLVILAVAFLGGGFGQLQSAVSGEPQIIQVDDNIGDAATVTLVVSDLASPTRAAIDEPSVLAFDNSAKIVDNTVTATIATTVGQTLDVFPDSNQSWYFDSVLDFEVDRTALSMAVNGYNVAGRANLDITGEDRTFTAMTAAAANQSQDYISLTLGASEVVPTYFTLRNSENNAAYHLGAICTWARGNISSFKIDEPGWTKVVVPDELSEATITNITNNNGAVNAWTSSWDGCWIPPVDSATGLNQIRLSEFEEITDMKFLVEATGTDPAATAGDVFGWCSFDSGYHRGGDGLQAHSFSSQDENGRVTEVGMDESAAGNTAFSAITQPSGLDNCVQVDAA